MSRNKWQEFVVFNILDGLIIINLNGLKSFYVVVGVVLKSALLSPRLHFKLKINKKCKQNLNLKGID